jgi:hypothetical protein
VSLDILSLDTAPDAQAWADLRRYRDAEAGGAGDQRDLLTEQDLDASLKRSSACSPSLVRVPISPTWAAC